MAANRATMKVADVQSLLKGIEKVLKSESILEREETPLVVGRLLGNVQAILNALDKRGSLNGADIGWFEAELNELSKDGYPFYGKKLSTCAMNGSCA